MSNEVVYDLFYKINRLSGIKDKQIRIILVSEGVFCNVEIAI